MLIFVPVSDIFASIGLRHLVTSVSVTVGCWSGGNLSVPFL